MSQIPNVNPFNSAQREQQFEGAGGINDVDIDDFLKIMITELQNQDPLNPLENDELIAQISQIRSVGATEKLTETLDSVLLGQNIASATNLIGAEIDAISDDNQRVTGLVEKVSVASGQPKLHLDLNPQAALSDEPGAVDQGEYEYLVVWTQAGTLFGVDPLASAPGKKIEIHEKGGAVQLSNLPVTQVAKHVYRREVGEQDYHLVGSISDGKSATFLDRVAKEDLSGLVLDGAPQLMQPARSFTVRLKNVGEIRPPNRNETPAPTTPTTPADDETTRPDYEPPRRPALPETGRPTFRPGERAPLTAADSTNS
jgi:flagellar basal-body rod modification protein FlgD